MTTKMKDELQEKFKNLIPGLTLAEQAALDRQTEALKSQAIAKAKAREEAEKRLSRMNEYISKVRKLIIDDRIERDRAFRKLKADYADINPDSLKEVNPPIPDVERLASWVEEVPREYAALLLMIWNRLSPEDKQFINGQFTSGKQALKQAVSTFIKAELKSMGWREMITLKEPPEQK